MKFLQLLIVAIAALVLSGCAQQMPPLNFSVPNVGMTTHKIDAEMKSLTVSVARPDEKTGNLDLKFASLDMNGQGGSLGDQMVPQMWQTSLTEALNRMVVFQDDATKKVNLSVKILKLDVPRAGVSFTSNTTARYEIMDRKTGDLIFSQDIESSGTTPGDFAFLGMARMRESINRAVQNNITQFLQALETVDVQKPMFPAKLGALK
jgi:PBP1b-binding outer membrane lipoprotein LpoB